MAVIIHFPGICWMVAWSLACSPLFTSELSISNGSIGFYQLEKDPPHDGTASKPRRYPIPRLGGVVGGKANRTILFWKHLFDAAAVSLALPNPWNDSAGAKRRQR
jgi:hypothetical protein